MKDVRKDFEMSEQFSRTQLIYGAKAMEHLGKCRVAVFGVGGVGGYVVEALARSGIGALDLIDNDKVCLSNLNRQIIATRSTIGQDKVDVARDRIMDINPDCVVRTYKVFYLPETQDQFDFTKYDYVVDAIDTVSGKLAIIENAKKANVPVISAMGAGNKVHPALFEVADIYETTVCPLAKVMRRECKKRGIDSLKVVYSKEPPIKPMEATDDGGDPLDKPELAPGKRSTPGSTAFSPSVAGLIIASEVINDLCDARVQRYKIGSCLHERDFDLGTRPNMRK